MKRIAIFCDGTWNSPKMPETTHVQKLFVAAQASEPDEKKQVARYIPGVGARRGLVNVERWVDKVGGGAFGWGLTRNIKQAYAELAAHYQPGDEIYLFGFSRGAFTARSLAGMIRKCGLPSGGRPSKRTLRKAMRLYRKGGLENHPDKAHILKERRALSPEYATSQKDLDWRGDGSHLLTIRYIGVWDTVGSLGVPNLLGPVSKLVNNRHKFHDLVLSSSVKSARHAMALDERRYFFEPSGWDNLEIYEDGSVGLNKGDTSKTRPYQQQWFAGDHSHVGGSGGNRALTSLTMDWIAEGAIKAKMILDKSKLLPGTPRDALSPTPITIDKKWVYGLSDGLYPPRDGPDPGEPHTLSGAAKTRVDGLPDYRPQSLRRLLPEIF